MKSSDIETDLVELGSGVAAVGQNTAGTQGDGPLLFALALLYLLLPAALVLFFFAPWPAATALATGFCIVWNYLPARAPHRLPPRWFAHTWPYLVLAAGIVWLSGALPPFAENSDWYKHFALFNLLSEQSWPPQVATDTGPATLRYSLGYYVVPSLAVKLFGAPVLPYAIFAWSTFGLYLVLVLAFGWRERRPARSLALGAVFLLFSGADIVGTSWTGFGKGPPFHYEWWAGFGELASTVTNLFWVPQHAIGGWLAAFLMLRFPQRGLAQAGVIGAALAVWSPFAAIGLLPVVGWTAWQCGWRALFSAMNLLPAPILLLSAGLFLTDGASGVPVYMVWHHAHFSVGVWAAFLLLEFGIICVALLAVNRRNWPLLTMVSAVLVLLSLAVVGGENDLLMRASIPMLGILAAMSAAAVVHAPLSAGKALLLACLAVGAVTPLGEIRRGFGAQRIVAPSSIRLLDAIKGYEHYAPQYLVFPKRTLVPRLNLAQLQFSPFGTGEFGSAPFRVASASFADAALVTQPLQLPAGLYRIDAVLDWDLQAGQPGGHGGHVSLQGVRILIKLPPGVQRGKAVSAYFSSDGTPKPISFGVGGWTTGKGSVTMRALTISAVR